MAGSHLGWNQGDRPPDMEEKNQRVAIVKGWEGKRLWVHSRYIHVKQEQHEHLNPPTIEPRLPPPHNYDFSKNLIMRAEGDFLPFEISSNSIEILLQRHLTEVWQTCLFSHSLS